MKFEIESRVYVEGIGTITHTHTQEFSEDSNVFGRVLEYHKYMEKHFGNRQFELVKAKEIR